MPSAGRGRHAATHWARHAAARPGGSSVRPLGHNAVVLLTELVLTSQAVAATPRRSVKIDEIAGLLRTAGPDEVPAVVAFLSGELLQRQIGVGYASLGGLLAGDGMADETAPTLTVSEVDAAFTEVGAVTGVATSRLTRNSIGSGDGIAAAVDALAAALPPRAAARGMPLAVSSALTSARNFALSMPVPGHVFGEPRSFLSIRSCSASVPVALSP